MRTLSVLARITPNLDPRVRNSFAYVNASWQCFEHFSSSLCIRLSWGCYWSPVSLQFVFPAMKSRTRHRVHQGPARGLFAPPSCPTSHTGRRLCKTVTQGLRVISANPRMTTSHLGTACGQLSKGDGRFWLLLASCRDFRRQ